MEAMKFSRGPMIAITALRVLVGWHFLYEGLTKLTAPSWSSAGYLKQARGPFAELFRWLASQPNLLANADLITMWGLALVGAVLILGLFTRLASLAGSASSCCSTWQPALRGLLLLDPHRGQLPDREQEPGGTVRARRHPRDGQRPVRRARPHRARPHPRRPRLAAAWRVRISRPIACTQFRRCAAATAVAPSAQQTVVRGHTPVPGVRLKESLVSQPFLRRARLSR